jgi:phospholipase C
MSGTISGPPGDHVQEDNSESTALQWSTYSDALTNASISWQVYQNTDNFDDNALAWFQHWQNLPAGTEKNKGLGFLGLQAFHDAAGNGTLPQFSIIVGPTELSEHPSNTPLAGSWLQQQVVNAVMNGKNWNSTASSLITMNLEDTLITSNLLKSLLMNMLLMQALVLK